MKMWTGRSVALMVVCACLFQAATAQTLDESTLARAWFRWSPEGWNCTTKDGREWPVSGELGQLKSNDDDDTIYYFSASPEFLGNKAEAYGGTIAFTLGHSEYNSLGLGHQDTDFDVILTSLVHNISLGHKNIIPPWVTSSDNVVEISEEGGWVHVDTGLPASRLAILRCISALTALKIRGSIYYGHEYSYLRDVILSRGVKQDLAWIRNDENIDEICKTLKLNHEACEWYGIYLMKAMQKVNMNKLKADHKKQQQKIKEQQTEAEERRSAWEREARKKREELAYDVKVHDERLADLEKKQKSSQKDQKAASSKQDAKKDKKDKKDKKKEENHKEYEISDGKVKEL